jgi:hypothetical protein
MYSEEEAWTQLRLYTNGVHAYKIQVGGLRGPPWLQGVSEGPHASHPSTQC